MNKKYFAQQYHNTAGSLDSVFKPARTLSTFASSTDEKTKLRLVIEAQINGSEADAVLALQDIQNYIAGLL